MGKLHSRILFSLVIFQFVTLVVGLSATSVRGESHTHLKSVEKVLQRVSVVAQIDVNAGDSRRPIFFKPMRSPSPCTDDFILTFFGPCSTSSMYPNAAPSELCCSGALAVSDKCLCYMQERLHSGNTLGVSLNGLFRILASCGRTSTPCKSHLPKESTAGANIGSP